MALSLSSLLDNDLMRSIGDAVRVPSFSPRVPDELDTIQAEAPALEALKHRAWDIAREQASLRAMDMGLSQYDPAALPGINDYLAAAYSPAMQQAVDASNPPVQWTTGAMMNFDNMKLQGIAIRRADLDPQALSTALQGVGVSEAKATVVGQEAKRFMSFDNTEFRETHFHPADTFDEYVKGQAARCEKVTFDGMGVGEEVVLKGGDFVDIMCSNFRGGELIVADGCSVTNLNIKGAEASLTIGRGAKVSGVDASGANLVEMNCGAGAILSDANFDGATISMASKMTGATLRDCDFTNASLDSVDLRFATLNNVCFNQTQLSQLDLCDARLINVSIDGQPVNSVDQLVGMGVIVNAATSIESRAEPVRTAEIEAPAPVHNDPLAEVIAGLKEALVIPPIQEMPAPHHDIQEAHIENMTSLSARRVDVAEQPAIAQVPDKPIVISGGEHVTLDDVALTRDVQQMERNPLTVAREAAQAADMALVRSV